MNPDLTLYCADAAADERGVIAAPVGVLVRTTAGSGAEIVAVGPLEEIKASSEAKRAHRVERRGELLLPALVNAHTHLDLTSIGPRPFDRDAGFAGWIGEIRQRRRTSDQDIRASVRQGVELSQAGGVAAVGDIAGAESLAPLEVMRASVLMGVSFLEVFGLGDAAESIDKLESIAANAEWSKDGVRLGLQPHAPYSAGPSLIQHCVSLHARTGAPLCMHVAESRDEHDCIANRSGRIREFLESIGIWNDEVAAQFGRAATPVQHLEKVLSAARWTIVHVNGCTDDDLATLKKAQATVVYCPRASAYFEHERDFGPHRYREMLERGITVALGTDSIVCLPPSEGSRLSTFDDMRFLHRRDGVDPCTLLRMATTSGAAALGLSPELFRLSPGPVAGLASIPVRARDEEDSLAAALRGDDAPRMLTSSNHSC